MGYEIYRQLIPTLVNGQFVANLEYAGVRQAKSAEDAIRQGKQMHILHPIVQEVDDIWK